MAWLFAESKALKAHLSGITVEDANAPSGRPVGVKFALPESELSKQTFPLIVIDFREATRDPEREHRGKTTLPYAPEGLDPWWPEGATSYDVTQSPYWVSDYPIPYNLDYQITVYSRKALHDLALQGVLAGHDRLPARFGYLAVPEDGTVRRLDLLASERFSTGKDEKRLFQQMYSVRISSELLPEIAAQAAAAMDIRINLSGFAGEIPLEFQPDA